MRGAGSEMAVTGGRASLPPDDPASLPPDDPASLPPDGPASSPTIGDPESLPPVGGPPPLSGGDPAARSCAGWQAAASQSPTSPPSPVIRNRFTVIRQSPGQPDQRSTANLRPSSPPAEHVLHTV